MTVLRWTQGNRGGMEKAKDSKQRLNTYIYDFLVKSALHNSARTFFEEAGLRQNRGFNEEIVARHSSRSYLYEWWEIFWELCAIKAHGSDNGSIKLSRVQAFYELWAKKKKQKNTMMAEEVRAASLQQIYEDAGRYKEDKVDTSEANFVVDSIPLQLDLRKSRSTSMGRVGKQKCSKRTEQSNSKKGIRYDKSLLASSDNTSRDENTRVNIVSHPFNSRTDSYSSQELQPFDGFDL